VNARSVWPLAICFLLACQAMPATAPGASAAVEPVALRLLDVPEDIPSGTDAVPALRYELVVGSRSRQLSPALDARLQGDAAIVWLPDHRLARFGIEGAPRLLARDVGSPPLVDAQRIVYALEAGDAVEVRVLDQGPERMLARGLSSAGAFRMHPQGQRVFFIGAINGGVAGLWIADLSGEAASCLTNCDLRTGQPWHHYVPPPASAQSLEFTDAIVRYQAVDGTTVTRSLR